MGMVPLFDVSRPRSILTYSGVDPDAPSENTASSTAVSAPTLNYRFVAGGQFGDVLPSGEFAVSVPNRSGTFTHRGLVPYYLNNPANGLQYIRATNTGRFRFAGQTVGTNSNNPATYHQGVLEGVFDVVSSDVEWVRRSSGVGQFPVIYDQHMMLRITMNGDNTGTEGFAYVDALSGEIIPRITTAIPPSRVRLWSWTDLGDGLYIGLGMSGGVLFFDGESYRVFQPSGAALSDRLVVNQDEDRVSIAAWHSGKPDNTTPMGISLWYGPMGGLYAMPVVNTEKYLQNGTLEVV